MESHWSSTRPEKRRVEQKPAPSFELGGEKFQCVDRLNAGALDDLVSGIQLSDDGERIYKAPSLVRFVRACIREEEEISVDEADERGISQSQRDAGSDDGRVIVPVDDVSRFNRLMRDKRRPIDIDDLGELAMWLAAYYGAERPTGRSAG